jgi:hypothetical protein
MLANTMEGHILNLSLQMYGCRVVQKVRAFMATSRFGHMSHPSFLGH